MESDNIMSEKNHILVILKPEARNDITFIANRLQALGMYDQKVLGEVGIITGSVDTTKLDSLRKVNGVESVIVDEKKKIQTP